MPIYEYRCRACQHAFSALVASSDTPEEDIVCPRCKGRRAEKLLSMKTAVVTNRRSSSSSSCKVPAGSGFT